jgi:hypothetical protein
VARARLGAAALKDFFLVLRELSREGVMVGGVDFEFFRGRQNVRAEYGHG